MNNDKYLQSINTGNIYKVMDQYLLQMSPWKDGDNRRVYEYDDHDMTVISYQNACMIVNKQFAETDEEWDHNGKHYKARALVNRNTDEHAALEFWVMFSQLFTAEKTLISIEWNTYGALFYNYLMNLNETDYMPEHSWRF